MTQELLRFDESEPESEQDTGTRFLRPRAVLLSASGAIAALFLIVVGSVFLYQTAYANRIYPGVRVFGNDLGGYSLQEARALLQDRVNELANRQLALTFKDRTWDMTAGDLGLQLDVSPVLESAYQVGRQGNIFERFWTQLGLWRQGRNFERPAAAYDPAVQAALLDRIAAEIERPAADSTLQVTPQLEVIQRPAQVGYTVDRDASRRRLSDALASSSASSVELVVNEIQPKTTDVDTAEAASDAQKILANSLELSFEDRLWSLDPQQLASILRFQREGSRLLARLDRPALEAWAHTLADAIAQTPQDARFSWSGGALGVLRPSRDGRELDVKGAVDLILQKAPSDDHRIQLPVTVTKPLTPMEDRQSLGIKELIKTSRTSYAGSVPAKAANIALAAERLNGTVVAPGQTFSFNKELGPTTLDAGFKIGWGVTTSGSGNIRTVPSVAGGICQVATTLFHSVFWSGYPIEQRNWHLYWISAYTSNGIVGLDATVDEDANLDFQFINPTKTHLLIQSWVDGSQNLNFALYGTTPDWKVTVDPPVRTETEKAESDKIYIEEEPTMPEGNRLAVERATDGFNIMIVRHVVNADGDRKLSLTSRYRASRNVILIGTGGRPASGVSKVEEVKPTATPAPTAEPTAEPTAAATAASVATPAPTAKPAAPAAPTRQPAATTAPAPTQKPAAATPTPTPKKR